MYGESASPLAMLLPTVIYPLLTAVALGFVIYKLEQKQQPKPVFWLATVLIWIAWLTAAQGIHTRWQMPPRQALDWLLLASLLPVLATRLPKHIRMTGFGVAALLGFALVAQPIITRMSTIDLFTHTIGWLLICGIAISAAERQKNSFSFPISQIVMLTTSAIVIGVASSLSIAQLIGALAAGLGGLWLLNRFIKLSDNAMLSITRATMALWLIVMAYAHYYGDVSIYALVLLATPLLICWSDKHDELWWKAMSKPIAISLIPGLLALWWVWPEQSLY